MTVTNHVDVLVAPDRLFELLADPEEFARIAGAELTEAAGPWPRTGSRVVLCYALRGGRGRLGRLGLTDTVLVRDLVPGRRLDLRAEVRHVLTSDLRMVIEDRDGTSCVTLFETPSGGPLARLPDGLLRRAIGRRNAGMLARLGRHGVDPHRPAEPERPGVEPEPAAAETDPARLPRPRPTSDHPVTRGPDLHSETHPEIHVAERTSRGDPYAGLRDGGFEYEATFSVDDPDDLQDFDYGASTDPDESTKHGRPVVE